MTGAERARAVAASVLRPHVGHDIAMERAAQIACCFDRDHLPSEADVRATLEGARDPMYGGAELSDPEIERLTQGVLLALGSL